jgi:hypothetical protein
MTAMSWPDRLRALYKGNSFLSPGKYDELADHIEALTLDAERLRTRRGYASQRLDKARAAAEDLLRKEQQHNGSGRDGHLNEADLVPLFEALGAVYLDGPDPQVFVSSDGDPE